MEFFAVSVEDSTILSIPDGSHEKIKRRVVLLKREAITVSDPTKATKKFDKNLLRLLMPSLIGMFLCAALLVGSTRAWFTASVQSSSQIIQAANYDIAVTVDNKSVDGSIELTAGRHAVTLTASGTAKRFGGYCRIDYNNTSLYTAPIMPDNTLTFTLNVQETATFTFTSLWGVYSGSPDISRDSDTINTANVLSYTVKAGDTLWSLASANNTTVETLASYNGIENPDLLQVGQELKIPTA